MRPEHYGDGVLLYFSDDRWHVFRLVRGLVWKERGAYRKEKRARRVAVRERREFDAFQLRVAQIRLVDAQVRQQFEREN